MSHDDKFFMSRGYRVRHKYKRGRGNTRTCALCGCKRKRFSDGWRYRFRCDAGWSPSNPPCVRKQESEAKR